MRMKRAGLAVLVSVAAVACQWVPLSPEGQRVRVASAADVAACRELGSVTGKTTVTVGPMARKEAKVAREVEALARNEAATMNADAIVPKGPLDWDQRTYTAYRCAP
jgi:hypothetical protein